jgi:hypothetical protein
MAKRHPGRIGWGVALAAVILLIGLGLMLPRQRLEVCRCETATPVISLDARPGMEFSVWFFHSYDRAFFQEHYCVEKGGRLVLTHMTFKSNLNGQGFEMGTYRSRPDGSAELADINREVEEITFRLGSPDLANHTLILGGRRLRLLDYADAGDMICIGVVSRPLWETLSGAHPGTTEKTSPQHRRYAHRSRHDGG